MIISSCSFLNDLGYVRQSLLREAGGRFIGLIGPGNQEIEAVCGPLLQQRFEIILSLHLREQIGIVKVEEGIRPMQEPRKTYNTSVEVTLEVMGGKWKPVILFHLTFGEKRNGELMSLMPAITQKVLTEQLRELEKDGVIERISYNQVHPKVEYKLTEYGWTLKDILHSMCRWGDVHLERVYGDNSSILTAAPSSGEME